MAAAAGCDRRPAEHHVVGHVANLSGAGHERGLDAVRGVRLAVERLNADAQQWISGKKVAVLHADTKGETALFGAQGVRLVTVNRAEALLGGATRAETEALAPVARDYPVALVGTSGFVGDPPADAAFAVGLTAAERARALATHLATLDKATRIVVVAADRSAAEAVVTDALHKAGVKFDEVSPEGDPLAAALRQADGVVVLPMSAAKAVALLTKHSEAMAGASGTVAFAGDGADAERFAAEHPGLTVLWAVAYHPAVETDAMRAFRDDFRSAFGAPPGSEAAASYDAARMLFAAAREAKGFEKGKVAKRLGETKAFAGLTGPLTIGADQVAHGPAFVLRSRAGKVEVAARLDPPAPDKSVSAHEVADVGIVG
jgi:branched-chain amino acid transport system substrate-binding protein